MLRHARRLPFLKILAIAQVALLVRRHLRGMDGDDRRRLAELARHPRSLTKADRDELRSLVAKLEPGAFVYSAADAISPVPLPGRVKRMLGGTDSSSGRARKVR